MCGIAGLFDRQARAGVNGGLLRHMTDALSHRGPDGSGFFEDAKVGLGHRRLSIIDLEGGAQPMKGLCGQQVITFNGEIYNFQELKRELEESGTVFHKKSDTEVLLEAYRRWGPECLGKLRGMFAFAIWDAGREVLFLARDRLGKKPLHYVELPNGLFLFASEIKALLHHPDVPRDYDHQAVEDYFALGHVPDPKTIFKSIHKLPAASYMEVHPGRATVTPKPYWDLEFKGDAALNLDTAVHELRAQLDEAVRLRMISDVPLGAFLSGGVDSSAIVALMAKHSDGPVNTCSIGFDVDDLDETHHAEDVARRFKTNHFSKVVASEDFGLLDVLAKVYDEPFADASALPTYRVCELARERVKVALSGDGGDEVLAGYRRHHMHMAEQAVRDILPMALRKPVFATLGALYPNLDWAPRAFRARSTFQSLAKGAVDAYFNTVSYTNDDDRAGLFSDRFRADLAGYHPKQAFHRVAEKAHCDDGLSLVQYIDIKTNLVGGILTKVDRASMAHGLEVRAPLLDHKFIEWSSHLTRSLKLRGREGKYVLKKAMEDQLPTSILYRSKMGFVSPISQWFKGPLAHRLHGLLDSSALLDTGIFDRSTLQKYAQDHMSGRRDHGRTLWALLMFEASVRQVTGSLESRAA